MLRNNGSAASDICIQQSNSTWGIFATKTSKAAPPFPSTRKFLFLYLRNIAERMGFSCEELWRLRLWRCFHPITFFLSYANHCMTNRTHSRRLYDAHNSHAGLARAQVWQAHTLMGGRCSFIWQKNMFPFLKIYCLKFKDRDNVTELIKSEICTTHEFVGIHFNT